MEICDGPIITAESCLNCVHSIEHKGNLLCGDRGLVLRMLMGLRQIERPNIEKCNRFEPIPQDTSKKCYFCRYFRPHQEMMACWNFSLPSLLLKGPALRFATDTCQKFELAQRFRERNIKQSTEKTR